VRDGPSIQTCRLALAVGDGVVERRCADEIPGRREHQVAADQHYRAALGIARALSVLGLPEADHAKLVGILRYIPVAGTG
jgi:hypothetical protein